MVNRTENMSMVDGEFAYHHYDYDNQHDYETTREGRPGPSY